MVRFKGNSKSKNKIIKIKIMKKGLKKINQCKTVYMHNKPFVQKFPFVHI